MVNQLFYLNKKSDFTGTALFLLQYVSGLKTAVISIVVKIVNKTARYYQFINIE